ncbi:MAG: NADAR family protein [Pirellula sp.]
MLDLKSLIERCQDCEQFEYLLFWGHTPAKDGTITKACFSQWYVAPFTIEGVVYPTAEHWMMAGKARLFSDNETLQEILVAPDPKSAKALGRKVRGFKDDLWVTNARRIVTEGNIAKFSQNEGLKEFLLATETKVLVEASPYDRIWGIGLGAEDPNAKHPTKWQGENLLGFALMDVREAIRLGV